MSRLEEIRNLVKNKEATVYVIGLGYIGLPTALFYSKAGFKVQGIDTNLTLVNELREGIIRMEEDGLEQLAQKYLSKISIETDYQGIESADICVLCLPSPIDDKKKSDNSYLEGAVIDIAKQHKRGCLILVESTVPVGITELLAKIFADNSGLKIETDFWFAHTPERVMPGQIVNEMKTIDRLVGGVTPDATEIAVEFLRTVFGSEQIYPTTSRVSETAKLAENAFRDNSIAFANELAVLCSALSVNVREVIQLANLHPRVEILSPGLGVGGYCFPKDGWILMDSAEKKGTVAQLIPVARAVNDGMPEHMFNVMLREIPGFITSKMSVGVIGLSYKENVSDTRNSPSLDFMRILKSKGIDALVYDPLVPEDFGFQKMDSLDEIVEKSEIIVIGVGHKDVLQALERIDFSEKILVDPRGVFKQAQAKARQYLGISS